MIALQRVGDQLRLQAMANGRLRYAVSVFRQTDNDDVLLASDLCNLGSQRARAGLSNQLPEDLRPEFLRLAVELGHIVAGHQFGSSKPDPAPAEPPLDPWPEPVATATALAQVHQRIAWHVVLGAPELDAVTLWVLHTYAIDAADFTPYLRVNSPVRECGKSSLLDVLQHLAHRAQLTGGITAAALYRRIDRSAPTMLLDELDTRLRDEGGEKLRGVLNTGFHRSGKVTICVGDTHEEKDFATFCPKVLAGIGRLWDTVTSRSIPIRMERASRTELSGIRKIRGDTIAAETANTRRQLLRWVEDARPLLRDAEPAVPEALGARQADVWRPLLAIAETAGDEWAERAQRAALALHGQGEDEGDYALLLLEDFRELFEQRQATALATSEIIESLVKREDRPWPEYRHERPITPRGVSSLLGRFNVKPRTVRIGDTTSKGYRAEDLAPVFKKYVTTKDPPIPPPLSVTSVTTPSSDPGVTDVTDRKGGMGPLAFAEDEAEREARHALREGA